MSSIIFNQDDIEEIDVRVRKKGRIVIWPAGFPYVHRGNPPLKHEKYILTSWMMLR